ncbi:terminase large subunit domain-containing protein [Pseudoalteromonas luteoviolacea]|uniref:Terminase n=1 Tax=Pseudoalteromonas luteoviolacea S4060-1 TaxID=1365257 RepID=A0A161YJ32_9GAMM|nr:terminase family protein [Pseudoalteromonas luteoviolacea]KZN61200.1 terminase [Pseudoalteromonas luteoviolacea S4060-1]
MQPKYDEKVRKRAKDLYVVEGYTFAEIAECEGMPNDRTIRRWAEKEDWDAQCPSFTAEMAIARQIVKLSEKEHKTDADYKELSFLIKCQCDLNKSHHAPAPKVRNTDNQSGSSKSKKKGKKLKNDVSSITKEQLDEVKDTLLYPHQQHWFENQEHRTRFLLKPRQIGATFYFSFEAFYDAIVNGRNKIFLSASRDQAEIFKANIIAIAKEYFDVELSGSPLTMNLGNGKQASLIFRSTNRNSAQSFSGDLYIDEVFWIPKFKSLNDVAKAMATQSEYRTTYFSTPSVTSHEAYPYWNGTWYRKVMACNDENFEVDVKHSNLKNGKLCGDGIWRQMLTVDDVVNSGFDKIDINLLRNEFDKQTYNNLFMCKFIDDAQSAFNIRELQKCIGDSGKWDDFDPFWPRPLAFKPVLIGFDPARTIDRATVVVLTLPGPGEKFRLLESHDLTGNRYQEMADFIQSLTERYNVQHIGVDTTGIGSGVFEMIEDFFPTAMPLHYSPQLKTRLVIKAQQVIGEGRLEFDKDYVQVSASFMNVRRQVKGENIIYASNRTAETGHADIAWAIMHAMIYEPLSGNSSSRKTRIGIAA